MSKRNSKKTITIDNWETEEEAAGAYNILNLIFNGLESKEWNDVPISLKTFDRVINYLHNDGWSCNEEEMRWLKNTLRIKFKMPFKSDA